MLRRIGVALFVLAALLGAFYWLRGRQAHEAREERREARLISLDARSVTSITVERGGAEARFERRDGDWRMTRPFDDPASKPTIDLLLRVADLAPVVRTIPDGEALSTFGLDPPRTRIRLEGGGEGALDIGDADPTGAGVFVRAEGRPGVLLVGNPLAAALAGASIEALRDPSPVGVSRTEVRAIALTGAGVDLGLAREASGWWIVRPLRLPASDGEVDRFLGALDGADLVRMEDGADPEDPRFGFGARAVRVRLTTADGEREILLGGADGEGRLWMRRDDRRSPMLVEAKDLSRASWSARDFAETRLTKVNRYAVRRVRFSGPGGELDALREGETIWKSPAGEPLRGDAILRFLVSALEAPISGWTSADTPSGAPRAELDVELDDGGKETITFWADGRATVASIPGIVFTLRGEVPRAPS